MGDALDYDQEFEPEFCLGCGSILAYETCEKCDENPNETESVK